VIDRKRLASVLAFVLGSDFVVGVAAAAFIGTRDFAPGPFGSFSFSAPEPGGAWQSVAAAPFAILVALRSCRDSAQAKTPR